MVGITALEFVNLAPSFADPHLLVFPIVNDFVIAKASALFVDFDDLIDDHKAKHEEDGENRRDEGSEPLHKLSESEMLAKDVVDLESNNDNQSEDCPLFESSLHSNC